MELNNDPLSEKESLQLINEMIGKAKKSYVTKGIASIVWGILIIICSMITWARVAYGFDPGFDEWLLVFFAVIPQIYFGIREKKRKNFVAHDEATMGYVWSTFGICIFLLSFYNGKFGGESSTTLFMMLYGMPVFITGGIFKFKPMIFGGIVCWLLAIVSLYTSFKTDMLFMAACGLFAWLVPGIILWNKYKMQLACNV